MNNAKLIRFPAWMVGWKGREPRVIPSRVLERAELRAGQRESGGEKIPPGSGQVVWLRRCAIWVGALPCLSLSFQTEGVGDEGCGSVCAGAVCLRHRGDDPAAGGAPVRPRPEDGGQDGCFD